MVMVIMSFSTSSHFSMLLYYILRVQDSFVSSETLLLGLVKERKFTTESLSQKFDKIVFSYFFRHIFITTVHGALAIKKDQEKDPKTKSK